MGAVQSVNYSKDVPQKINVLDLPVIRTNQITKGKDNNIIVDKGDIKIVETHFKNQLETLKAYLNMYFSIFILNWTAFVFGLAQLIQRE
mgnify:CR=1 FL=1